MIGALLTGALSGVLLSLIANYGLKSPKEHRLAWVFVIGALQLGALLGMVFVRDNIFHVSPTDRGPFLLAYGVGLLIAAIPLFMKWGRKKQ